VHTLDVQVDEADVAAMISEYETSGEKTWIPGTVTIDGTELSDVGLRLKGNSSLSTLDADADPATLPWLVRLDKYVDGQSYRDITSFVVRSNITTTAVNEAVALELIELAGLASQQATSVRLTVNDGTARLRLVIENPDEDWASSVFDSPGLLYKSEARGDWSYRGDDPASYTDVFDQQAGEDDLTPLIELLDFVNNADDATFAAELADRVDVEAFARYLAVQELVGNFDTISGPGNNSYLWYDAETEVFTVVSWDQNLSFGITPMAGGMGGGPGVGGSLPDGMDPGNPPAMPEDFDPDNRSASPRWPAAWAVARASGARCPTAWTRATPPRCRRASTPATCRRASTPTTRRRASTPTTRRRASTPATSRPAAWGVWAATSSRSGSGPPPSSPPSTTRRWPT